MKKENAERGPAHRTARKLEALFESVIPPVPELINAYGKRCTHIIEAPGIDPTGESRRYGPFADYVGADATSIWAAATSGTPSIAVHLLACMLARNSSDPVMTTSVWVELISERKQDIQRSAQCSTSTAAQFAAANAAGQEFSREELQRWDASARGWLRSADSAMRTRQKELDLILSNIELPVAPGGDSICEYHPGMNTGHGRARVADNGTPQSVTDGAIILAISSWHLYPSLLVCGPTFTKAVDTTDPLLAPGGRVTIGISVDRGESRSKGIYWSLSPSHYRHYGRPVEMTTQRDNRLTIEEFQVASFGSLLSQWNVPRRNPLPAARWIQALRDCASRHDKFGPGTSAPLASYPRFDGRSYSIQ